MTVATTYSSAELGIDAPRVTVETDVSAGLPQVLIVGLPETAVRESRDRVKAAIKSSGFEFPSNRITVNLAPADLPKSGGRYDLAIALAILAASKQLPIDELRRYEVLGELSLTGSVRSVSGVLPAALRNRADDQRLVVPASNGSEAAVSQSNDILLATSLKQVTAHLSGHDALPCAIYAPPDNSHNCPLSIGDIKGQSNAKRALSIAATGGHNLLMVGPPGTGKTMLASRLPSLIPPMNLSESLEVASLSSVSRQKFDFHQWGLRPFRSPHHTASAVAMVGGSSPPKPGEISLAHHGVLFLDELPEFSRQVLEVLREPLESGEIWISRAAQQVRYPARFQLVAAMNPCPCGYYGDQNQICECSMDRIHRYRNKLSGPLLDRIDLHIEVPPLPPGKLSESSPPNDIDNELPALVDSARIRMLARQGCVNANLSGPEIERYCALPRKDSLAFDDAVTQLGISARGYYKILKIARTIADLSADEKLNHNHVTEALGYRRLDRLGRTR